VFYPLVFPVECRLDPEAALEVESAAVATLIGGDRAYQRRLSEEQMASGMFDELRFMGLVPEEREAEVRRLIEANARHMVAFLRDVPAEKADSDWLWAMPDPGAFRRLLKSEARERWWPLLLQQLRAPIDARPLAEVGA
jgi:hypothetical protein